MQRKPIPKKLLDETIAECRKYWNDDPGGLSWADILPLCQRLHKATGINWNSWSDFLSAILPRTGLKADATNEDIYAVLRLLGWEVAD